MSFNEAYEFVNGLRFNKTETLDELNARYAEALFPLTLTFGLFTLFGVVGNVAILIVFSYSREYKHNNFKVFVLTLAVIDLITCVTLIPAKMIKQRHYFDFGDVFTCKIKCFFNVFGACASYLALLVISVDRFRKVVQPFKKQMKPTLCVKILLVFAIVVPVLLATPSALMCGIKMTNMTNIYGGKTTIHLCETEERYVNSVWRKVYKYFLICLNCVISVTYIVLYTFIMKEAAKQIRSIRLQRFSSANNVAFASTTHDPRVIIAPKPETRANGNNKIQEEQQPCHVKLTTNTPMPLANRQLNHLSISRQTIDSCVSSVNSFDSKTKTRLGRFSVKSIKRYRQNLRRKGFPTKTMIWFTLTVVMIITYLTNAVLTLQVAKVSSMSAKQFSTFSFFYRIYFINHMINPLVYAAFVKQFRDSCKHIVLIIKSKILHCR